MAHKKPNRTTPAWFSLQRYAWAEDLLKSDPVLLYQEFLYRVEAWNHDDIRTAILPIIQRGDGRLTKKSLEIFALQPATPNVVQEGNLDLIETNQHPFLIGTPAISPLTTKDLARLVQQTDPRALTTSSDTNAESPADQTNFPLQWRKKEMGLLDRLSVDSHRYSRKAAPETDHSIHCKINLDHSDKVILASLKKYLKIWRQELNEAAGHQRAEPESAEKNLRKIVTYRLIPLLDLKIWAKSANADLTAKIMAAKIFPEGERGEDSYRKTVDHMLDELMAPEGKNGLYSAAIAATLAIHD